MPFEAKNKSSRTMEERLQELLDKDEIRDLIARVCRAQDRFDQELYASCFYPDASIDYSPIYAGSVDGLVGTMSIAHKFFDRSQYNTGTQLIEVDGDIGRAETYIYCAKVLPERDEKGDQYGRISGFRYIDRLERRKGEWRIAHRTNVPEWGMFFTIPAEPKSIGMFKAPSEWELQPVPSMRNRTDLSYNI